MVDLKPTTYILIPSNLNWTVIYYRRKTYHADSQPGEANKKLKNSLKIQGYLKHTEFILVFHLFINGILKYPQKKKIEIMDQLDKTTG